MSQPDVAILCALRKALRAGVSSAALAAELQIGPDELEPRISDLRAAGYVIAETPHTGPRIYTLTSAPDRLIADDLRAGLFSCVIGNRILVFEETRSTNDVVLNLAASGMDEGLVVFAERQTGGRGQRGNRWESASHKGLWFSILLRPKLPISDSARLTTFAAAAVAEAISTQMHLPARVRPLNDVYVSERKVAGVLVECRAESDDRLTAVLGIGLNINHQPADFPEELQSRATSLAMLTGGIVDRRAIAVALLQQLDANYAEFRNVPVAAPL